MPARAHLWLAGSLVVLASAAHGEVFEVGRDGAVRSRVQVEGFVWGGDPMLEEGAGIGEEAPPLPSAALTMVAAPDAPEQFREALIKAAVRYDVSPNLLAAVVWRESRWRPGALSPKGAIGLGQLMPGTARALAVDPRDTGANLAGAAHYLRQMLDLFDGNVERALAAYNAGPGRVRRAGGIPAIAETRSYVSTIIDRLALRPALLAGDAP